ncbi:MULTISPECIES: PAS domain-containing protein [Streptomyces]|uniref:PAS domain-containing protein n=1 Tax=Streptomyces TaxID=1883 RepID=UPI001D1796F3|nr:MULTISPECIES: PAS domain-containing protein [Streptomyces]MCX5036172.1 PAS domain-containing protein [Streptomyces coelicoflavus]
MTGGPIGDTAVLNALFANSPQGLFVFGSEQRIARYNPAGRGVRGLSAEDVVGRRVEELAPGFEAGELQRLIDEVLATAEPLRGRLVRGDRVRLLTEVTDASSASPHLRRARESDEGGRGLFIVMRLSSHWGVRHSRHDKTIWSEQRLDAGSAPDAADLMDAFDVPDAGER